MTEPRQGRDIIRLVALNYIVLKMIRDLIIILIIKGLTISRYLKRFNMRLNFQFFASDSFDLTSKIRNDLVLFDYYVIQISRII